MEPVVVVTIPHRLGRAEALRRVKAGLEEARKRYAAQLKVAEENWEGDRLRFRVAVLGQSLTGAIDIADDSVRTEVTLTWLMGHQVKPAEALIEKEGRAMLDAP
jgi:Putative polyhydroxyalkanoic acid system protein (PHA_gran_rgn)